ncbi:hypothetical protein [Achromobacter deleyi]|uniref:hypothetical protein n=1 Tax=Achromobacter deleyi TaxID=1353891 RepID=UPI0014926868|nr:hypothetical protein [Achromobacter deleyi]QVQ27071.1 hypothetical protein HLG70_01020 [Achromobacter deleyi]UIP22656.1 hypothetical protein LYZ39_09125 [Achromobacter deleyi]
MPVEFDKSLREPRSLLKLFPYLRVSARLAFQAPLKKGWPNRQSQRQIVKSFVCRFSLSIVKRMLVRKSMVLIVPSSALWMPGMGLACVDPDTRMQAPRHRVGQTRSIGGNGRSVFDEDGDRQGIYLAGGLDLQKRIHPITSFEFPKRARLTPGSSPAARLAAFRTAVFGGAVALQAAKNTAQVRRL